ncbi:fatty acid amide hydrolase-like isoform X2 [Dendronephthya gigantea]|uniref:fatty acid amide hydrolase-like isoform X2 n=1 Tax=Dendronephthya gigantea TaxID=151771 RepID=UPI00106C396F|nr:fatty acid amide hydrolase-like isoform X2 [Dendronephthya gigantea]
MKCIFKWRITQFLKNIIIKEAVRDGNIGFLQQISIPDPPTLIPQISPSKEQQLHQRSDLASLLKKPSNVKGFQFLSISDLVEAYRNGKTSPLQVTENALEAIEQSEKQNFELKAFVQFNKTDALQMAQESTKRYAEGKTLSVIDGIPVGIKGEYAVAGYHRRCGTVFMGQEAEEKDCNLVAKLRSLGAVIIGMTNMHELGLGTTGVNPNSYHGISRNPYDLNYFTGGSSGGSAAAVAAGLCPVAIGKDGGGSIRLPSTLCGIVGIKPTFGRVTLQTSRYGSYSVSHAGPMCNNVRDTAIMYALLSGRDPEYPAGMIQPEHATLEGFENLDLSDLTVGVDWDFAQFADDEIIEHFKKAVEFLKSRGANIVSVQIPELEESRIAHILTIGCEITHAVDNEYPNDIEKLNPDTFLLASIGRHSHPFDFYQCQKQRTRAIEFLKTIFQNVDCILTPGSACCAKKIPSNAKGYGLSDVSLTMKYVRFHFLGNLTGVPGVVVPVGYDDQGLPIGVQVMTSWWEEHVALRVAHCLEGLVERKEPKVYFDILNKKGS